VGAVHGVRSGQVILLKKRYIRPLITKGEERAVSDGDEGWMDDEETGCDRRERVSE
jgi:hypothetical protein